MKIDKEKFVCIGQEKLPDTIRYKRGNIFLIILGYVFAVIAGVNGVDVFMTYSIIYWGTSTWG